MRCRPFGQTLVIAAVLVLVIVAVAVVLVLALVRIAHQWTPKRVNLLAAVRRFHLMVMVVIVHFVIDQYFSPAAIGIAIVIGKVDPVPDLVLEQTAKVVGEELVVVASLATQKV